MRRRNAISLFGMALLAPGCLDSVPVGSSDAHVPVGCANLDRPESDAPSDEFKNVRVPVPYPTPPDSWSDRSVSLYVEEFERAYRRNALVEQWGNRLDGHGLSVKSVSTTAVEDGVRAVIEYHYWENVEFEDEIIHGDSPLTRIGYHVGDATVYRAEDEYPFDEALPDPRVDGDLVACVDSSTTGGRFFSLHR